MPTTIEGTLSAQGLKLAIVASRFNALIVEPLVQGAVDAFVRSGGNDADVTIVRCPGAWELPQVVRRVLARGGVDAVVALGAVIRGATPHFDYVSANTASGVFRAGYESGVPVIFGVLTTNTVEEAIDRAGVKAGNKGRDAAAAAVEMADLLRQIRPD